MLIESSHLHLPSVFLPAASAQILEMQVKLTVNGSQLITVVI